MEGEESAAPAAGEEAAPVEGAEAPAEGAEAPKAEEAPVLDALETALDLEDPADWVKALDAISDKNDGKPHSISQEALDGLPIEAKQAIANIRRRMQESNTAANAAKTAAETALKEHTSQTSKLQDERASLYAIFQDPRFAAFTTKPEGEAPDPYSPEGQAFATQTLVAEILQKFMGEIGTVSEEARKAVADKVHAAAHVEKLSALKVLIADTPDWDDHADDIAALVKTHKLEAVDALRLVRARKGIAAPIKADPAAAVRKARRAGQTLSRPGGAKREVRPEVPKSRNTNEIMEHYRANPDAMHADFAKLERDGTSL